MCEDVGLSTSFWGRSEVMTEAYPSDKRPVVAGETLSGKEASRGMLEPSIPVTIRSQDNPVSNTSADSVSNGGRRRNHFICSHSQPIAWAILTMLFFSC